MHIRRFAIALCAATLLAAAQAGASPVPPPAGATGALDARKLAAARTASGFTLSGQAYVKDGCQGARFVLSAMKPMRYDLVQFRRPGTMGMMCIMRLAWVTAAPLAVATNKTPASVAVRTQAQPYRIAVK